MCVQNRRFRNLDYKTSNSNDIDDDFVRENTEIDDDNDLLATLATATDGDLRFAHLGSVDANDQDYPNDMNSQRVEYLEKKLLKSLRNWLSSKGFWPLTKNLLKSIGLRSDQEASGRLFEMNLNEGDEFGRRRLIKVLRFTKQFNACMFICHSILLLNTILYGSWQNYYQFNDPAAAAATTTISAACSTRSSFADIMIEKGASSTTTTSSLSSIALSVTNSSTGGYIGFHFLWVTILDFLNNLYWYHSKQTIASGRQDHTWLKSILHILTNPRQLFQATYVCLFIGVGPLTGLGMLLSPFNSITQILRHCYNWYRIRRYLRMLKPIEGSQGSISIINNNNNQDYNNNDITTTNIINTNDRRSDIGHDVNHDNNNNNDLSLMFMTRSIQGELCNEDPGWPRHGSRHSRDRPGRRHGLSTSTMHKFERLHMMSQMLGVKLTIFTLVLHIDALNSRRSLESLISLACLVEAFLAMYSYYDKYYSRYMDRRGHLLRRASLLVMQLRQRQQLQRLHSDTMAAGQPGGGVRGSNE